MTLIQQIIYFLLILTKKKFQSKAQKKDTYNQKIKSNRVASTNIINLKENEINPNIENEPKIEKKIKEEFIKNSIN